MVWDVMSDTFLLLQWKNKSREEDLSYHIENKMANVSFLKNEKMRFFNHRYLLNSFKTLGIFYFKLLNLNAMQFSGLKYWMKVSYLKKEYCWKFWHLILKICIKIHENPSVCLFVCTYLQFFRPLPMVRFQIWLHFWNPWTMAVLIKLFAVH